MLGLLHVIFTNTHIQWYSVIKNKEKMFYKHDTVWGSFKGSKLKECDGMNRNSVEEFLKEEARRIRQEEDEFRENPLMKYSTSQLKAELRRRKKELC